MFQSNDLNINHLLNFIIFNTNKITLREKKLLSEKIRA